MLALLCAACSGREIEAPPGEPGGICLDQSRCNDGSVCSNADFCYDELSPCEGYECGLGTCVDLEGTPFCECGLGQIHAEGSAPCVASNAGPRPVPGQLGGQCLLFADPCEQGVCSTEPRYCYLPENPCQGFACGGHDRGRCEPEDMLPSCLCEPGFDNERYPLYCCPIDGSDPLCEQ